MVSNYKCTATHGTPRGTHGGPRSVVQQIPKGWYNTQGGFDIFRSQIITEVARRLVHEAKVANMWIKWIKVKGHSGDVGNDAADKCATWGLNGVAAHVKPIMKVMQLW